MTLAMAIEERLVSEAAQILESWGTCATARNEAHTKAALIGPMLGAFLAEGFSRVRS